MPATILSSVMAINFEHIPGDVDHVEGLGDHQRVALFGCGAL